MIGINQLRLAATHPRVAQPHRCALRLVKALRRSLAHGLAITAVVGVWAPLATAAPPPSLSDAVRKYIYRHVTDVVGEDPFRFALVDLNGDGREDAIVLMSASDWCGSGGCTMLIFRGVESGFEYICSSTVTLAPIRVSKKMVRGWRSLIVFSKGKGDVVMRFTEAARYPGNPSVQPKASRSEVDAASFAIQ
jgi:hypothetical protein